MKPEARRAVCPGSFDPVTYGHLDIVGRSAQLYDEVWVAVFHNASKSGLFDVEERLELLRETTADMPNVKVASFQGLVVDFCKQHEVGIIVKGVRAVSDFDYEQQMAQMNFGLGGVETLFMPTNPLYSFLSSSLVKDAAKWGGDIDSHVPDVVARRLHAKFAPEQG
ncbi:pantetheine-phosphate adenylyltransferase [Salininema proteolyticum]|uniref:Phosphopantetheine adenylyltransferase n=1 Tax=Salininema proteolyticum TaxID=1607685 RepID=A0ABV8TYY0_9ACTN